MYLDDLDNLVCNISEMPTLKTVHKTVSEHGGVVRDPLYLKNPFVFLGNKSTNGNVSISCVSSLETCINYVVALLIKYIKGPTQAPSYLVTAELRTCRYM